MKNKFTFNLFYNNDGDQYFEKIMESILLTHIKNVINNDDF